MDLSRRIAVLLRGGPWWKGSGGIIMYTFSPFAPPFPLRLGASSVIFIVVQKEIFLVLLLRHAVVLLLGAVVPQAPAIVPQALAVVP